MKRKIEPYYVITWDFNKDQIEKYNIMDTQNRNRNNNIFLDKPVQEKICKEIIIMLEI